MDSVFIPFAKMVSISQIHCRKVFFTYTDKRDITNTIIIQELVPIWECLRFVDVGVQELH